MLLGPLYFSGSRSMDCNFYPQPSHSETRRNLPEKGQVRQTENEGDANAVNACPPGGDHIVPVTHGLAVRYTVFPHVTT